MERDEDRWVREINLLDESTFTRSISFFENGIKKLVGMSVGNRTDAEEIVQEVFLDLVKCVRSHSEPNSRIKSLKHLKDLAYTIAKRRIADWYRKRNRSAEVSVESIEEFPDDNIADGTNVESAILKLRAAINRLPEIDQTIINLKFHSRGRMTFSQIGNLIDRTESSVKTRFRRAKDVLRRAIERDEPN